MHLLQRDIERIEADWEAFDQHMGSELRAQQALTKQLRQAEPEEYLALPLDPNSPRIDWWSKYYFSKGQLDKAPGYAELGLERLLVFKGPLEDVGEYRGFEDFLDTFVFTRPYGNGKLDKDTVLNAERKGELKGKLFITKHEDQKRECGSTPCVQ